MNRAVLLVNLGTPDAPTVPAVRRYLKEFLSDPHVIDLPALFRWLLLHLVILPFRPKRSAHAYQQIWTAKGSPLLLHSQAQRDALAPRVPGVNVKLAMRYGQPSIPSVLEQLRSEGAREVTVVPLYPQRADATTTTSVEHVKRLASGFELKVVPPFHASPKFIAACAERVKQTVASSGAQHVVFSYHGLPVRHVARACSTPCERTTECPASKAGSDCYRAQCFATSRAVAAAAGLTSFSTAFQSRLKGATWIGPFTDEELTRFAQAGIKRIAVACPSFVADCLETLEEIGQRGAETFRAAGGESLTLVPAVNDDPAFIDALADEIRKVSP